MAVQAETVILDVQLDAAKVASDLTEISRKIALVKNEQKMLDEEYKQGKITTAEYTQSQVAMKDELSFLQKEQKGLVATTKLLTAQTDTYSDSLNGERQKLADMQKAYDQLNAAQRESEGGKAFLASIKQQSDAVKGMEEATGRAQRNVGNYQSALDGAGISLGNFTKKMKAFVMNPWVLLIGAIVGVFKKLVDAFKSSEDRMNELRSAFAPLKGAVDLVKQAFDAFAKVVSGIVVKALSKAVDGVKWLAVLIDKVGAKFGKDFGLAEAFKRVAENSEKATAAEQRYIKHRREFVTIEAQTNNEIARLRDKSVQKDKYSAEQRIAFVDAAIAKEQQLARERKQLAQENLAALEAEASRSENDAEMNDKLEEAKAAVIQADTEFYTTTRRLQTQRQAFIAEMQKENPILEAVADATDDLTRAQEDNVEMTDEQGKKYEDIVKRIKEWTQTDIERLEEQMAADLETANLTEEQKIAIEQHYQEAIKEIRDAARKEEAESERQTMTEKAEAIDMWASQATAAYNAINSAIKAGEDAELANYKKDLNKKKDALNAQLKSGQISQEIYNASISQMDADLDRKKATLQDKAARREKAINIFSATISTATAIIKALADPGGIPGIVLSALAAVTGAAQIAAIAAQPLPSAAFADGGIVPGSSYSGDKVTVRANSGEMYINRQQQRQLFDSINSGNLGIGINYEALGATMAAAVAAQPAPVVDFTEMQEFSQKVSTYNEIASI